MMRVCAALVACFVIAACSEKSPTPTFHAEGYPEQLSAWGVLSARNGVLHVSKGATPYDLATPLFSDYALKLRAVSLPDGAAASYDAEDVFDLPVGTIISKTFYYETDGEPGVVRAQGTRVVKDGAMPLRGVRLIETRILAHREAGWIALAYVWNEAQTEARLKRTGEVIPLTLARADGRREAFNYLVPNANQCAGCHATNNTTRAIHPIGLKARHLNKPSTFNAGFNQLDWWKASGLLEVSEGEAAAAPKNAVWGDAAFSLDARARAYLDANCSHCHSNVGPADTSGLDLRPSTPLGPSYGYCKSPIAAGNGSGGLPFDFVPGHPEQSIAVFRLETTDPAAMMPELGRAVTHEEGVALIREWIAKMDGSCG
ncbi:MAG: SO2930 family diheme c-type cytochrome [Pseudomonadota bacterium]|nr:SO2930 family diheme c-type cytochrome [Pseudomonadota bacterium]